MVWGKILKELKEKEGNRNCAADKALRAAPAPPEYTEPTGVGWFGT